MKKNLFGSARAFAVFVAMIVAASSTKLYATDSNNRYFAYGIGQGACEGYVKFRDKRLEQFNEPHERFTKDELYEVADKIAEQWIAGFLTAHNLYVSDTYDLVGGLTMDDLKAQIEKSCRANSQQYIAEAVITVARELHPKRVRAEAAK